MNNKLPELVVWTIYNYIKNDKDKLKYVNMDIFKNYINDNNSKNKTYIYLNNEYNINNALEYMKLSSNVKIKLNYTVNYFDSILNNYRHQIYGCYINNYNELLELYKHNNQSSITHLTFGSAFNQPVDNLPNTITDLIIEGSFNQSLDNLPATLKRLMVN